MFADSLLDAAWTDHSRRGWTTFVSFAVQAIAAGVFLLLPLFLYASSAAVSIDGAAGGANSATGPAPYRAHAKRSA